MMFGVGVLYSNNFGVWIFLGIVYVWQGEIDEVVIWDDEYYIGNFMLVGLIMGGMVGFVVLWYFDNNGIDNVVGEGGGGGVILIVFDNVGILYSLYMWDVDVMCVQMINLGVYFCMLFIGVSVVLNFDMIDVISLVLCLCISVDGRINQSVNVVVIVLVMMFSGQDNDMYLLEVWVDVMIEIVNCWNSLQNVVIKFIGIMLVVGDDMVMLLQCWLLNLLCYGDSIMEGVCMLVFNGINDLDCNSVIVCWLFELGCQFGVEVGVVGFGLQGISDIGNGNVLVMVDLWDWLWVSEVCVFMLVLDYCVWLQGYNDGINNMQVNGIVVLDGMLMVMLSMQFVLFCLFDGIN